MSNIDFDVSYYLCRVGFWRSAFFISIIVFCLFSFVKGGAVLGVRQSVALIKIDSFIDMKKFNLNKIRSIAEDSKYSGLLVSINSGGGSFVASEQIYDAISYVAGKKPVISLVNEMALSGGYMVALAGDVIVAHNGSMVGSVGVLSSLLDVSKGLEKLGIKSLEFSSGDAKSMYDAEGNVNQRHRDNISVLVNEGAVFFRELVRDRRGLSDAHIDEISSGGVYSSSSAMKLDLIDTIGNMDAALKLMREKCNNSSLEVSSVSVLNEGNFSIFDGANINSRVVAFLKYVYNSLVYIF